MFVKRCTGGFRRYTGPTPPFGSVTFQIVDHELRTGVGMIQDDQEPSGHGVDQTSVGGLLVGRRIAQARRDAALTQRALADLAGVRLWVVDRWESGARALSSEQLESVARATKRTAQWLQTGVDEHLSFPSATNQADSVAPFERAHQEVDERVPAAGSSGAKAEAKAHELELESADAAEETTPESMPTELREAQADKRAVLGDSEDDVSGFEEDAGRHEELLARIAEREDALARTELEVQQALAQLDRLRTELWHERAELAEIDEVRRQVDAARAEIVERDRVVTEREAQVAELVVGLGDGASDLRTAAQWLSGSVKAAAKREAETVIKAARAQARLILAQAKAGQAPPAEDIYEDEPVQEHNSQPR